MKNLKLSKMNLQRMRINPNLKTLFLFGFFFLTYFMSFAQLGELASEIENAEGDVETIADSVIQIVKIIAGVALAIAALSFLYLRNQESDMSKKAGQVVVGIAIFFVILSMVDVIREL